MLHESSRVLVSANQNEDGVTLRSRVLEFIRNRNACEDVIFLSKALKFLTHYLYFRVI